MAFYCVVFACSQVWLRVGKIANNSRPIAKSPMKTAWIHGGALRAPPCIDGEVMEDFAMGRELFVIFPMRGTWLHAKTTQYKAMSIT